MSFDIFTDAFNELQVPTHLLDRSITPPQGAIVTTPFLTVDCPTAYNVILGRPIFAQMRRLEEKGATINSLGHKLGDGRNSFGKASNVLDRLRYLHVQDHLKTLICAKTGHLRMTL
ncbi:unnamed protein product [Prunus armeniaca]